MATFDFGTKELKTVDSVTEELYELMGFKFPVSSTVSNGEVVAFSFETEWKVGGTVPVEEEVTDEEGVTRTVVTGYAEDYKTYKMNDEHIAKLKKWASENVKQ